MLPHARKPSFNPTKREAKKVLAIRKGIQKFRGSFDVAHLSFGYTKGVKKNVPSPFKWGAQQVSPSLEGGAKKVQTHHLAFFSPLSPEGLHWWGSLDEGGVLFTYSVSPKPLLIRYLLHRVKKEVPLSNHRSVMVTCTV